MRGADCSTDHLMLRTKIKFSIDNKHNKSGARPPKKLAGKELRNNKTKAALVEELNKALEGWNNSDRDKNIEDCWSELKTTVYDTAEKVIPKQKRKHQDWFDENDGRLKVLIETRNAAREQQLQRNTRASKARYLKARNELQRYTSQMKSDWWEMKAMALQLAADMNNMKEFYSGLREIYGPQLRGSTQLISADGATVLQEKEEILDRFADHFSQLLNIPGELDEEAKDNIEQKEIVTSLDDPPNLGEILTAISNISEGKAPGRDGIPAETIEAKCKVYRAVVLSTLLYGAETWTVYRTHVKKLHGYMMRQLRNIMNISWQDKVTNKDILKRAGLPSMADLLIKKNLRWLGHVERMDHERLPRQLLYSQLSEGVRNQGRPRLRFKDVCKRNMKWKDIDLNNWKQSAVDRQKWRSMIGD